jgi:hypothetical protein
MSRQASELPEGVKIPQRYRRKPNLRRRFMEGARDGAANRAFAHNDEQAFTQQHGQAEATAYAEGYNEGRAARNDARIDTAGPK